MMKNMRMEKLRFYDEKYGHDVYMVVRYGLLPPGDGVPAFFSVSCKCYKLGLKALPDGTKKETKSAFIDLSVTDGWRGKACELCPGLADIIRLHGCDIKGAPLMGARDALALLGMAWHDVSRRKEYTKALAAYLRVPYMEAVRLVNEYVAGRLKRQGLDRYMAKQKPRWKKEADAVIKKYKFVV